MGWFLFFVFFFQCCNFFFEACSCPFNVSEILQTNLTLQKPWLSLLGKDSREVVSFITFVPSPAFLFPRGRDSRYRRQVKR